MRPITLLRVLAHELTSAQSSIRIPEPDLVMSDEQQVSAFTAGGGVDGSLRPVYQVHLEGLSKRVKPGDVVLDLGCGSGQLLALTAQAFPEIQLIGLDLSETMLEAAKSLVGVRGLTNVKFLHANAEDLLPVGDESVDVVTSSVALHHLPNLNSLRRCFSNINRVLKPDGCVLLTDLGRLKSPQSQRLLADEKRGRQLDFLTRDYEHSMRAAFSVEDWRFVLGEITKTRVFLQSMPMICFLIQIGSEPGVDYPNARHYLKSLKRSMTLEQWTDYLAIKISLRFGRNPFRKTPSPLYVRSS